MRAEASPQTTARSVPIGDYGLIGDTRSAALVAPDGSIDWWCVTRFDDPPLFGRLVGGDPAGTFSIRPDEEAHDLRRAYRPDTVTLTTTWGVEGGELELADTLVAEVEGRFLPGTLLVRRLTARGRPVRAQLHLAPRFGYERRSSKRQTRRAGALVCERGELAIAVTSDGPELEADRTIEFEVRPDQPVTIALTAARRSALIIVPPAVAAAEVVRDEDGWRSWAAGIEATRHRAAVVRSLMTLQLLTYSPSGAPVAAPTTSLPERVGGERNWDYRYAWPRDASIGIAAFLASGKPQEARAFLAWLLHASRLARPRLPVLFTLDGRPGPPEAQLDGWPGYAGSQPVRIGNGAASQHQLDGYGWVVDAAWLLTDAGHPLYGETWRAVAGFADRVAAMWTEPDAGIWEKRAEPAHHVHSKLMAWLALDRATRIAAARSDRRRRRAQRWANARAAIADDIRSRGFDPDQGAYTASYGSTELDAALLILPLLESEPTTNPRVIGTVDRVRQQLGAGGPLLYRYPPGSDGLTGGEGAFLPCSFWLVQALALTGRREAAETLLDELVTLGGPLGLFGEEMDPATGEHLGNFPQALTHAALVQAVSALDDVATGGTRQHTRSW
ncbi:MAG TPA: glycoside hydrolase family 15 protein [Acidimicrobiales bacterium]|nr:glycoside hydrolase family 15 protein [Acidimicrobiales bacterium]